MTDFNIFNSIERSQWKIDNSSKKLNLVDDNRFDLDIKLLDKGANEKNTSLVNSLKEELETMKYKMKFYYEKEEEVTQLKNVIVKLSSEIENIKSYKRIILILKNQNLEYENQYRKLLSDLHRNIQENKQLKEQIDMLKKKQTQPLKIDLSELYTTNINNIDISEITEDSDSESESE